MRWARVVLSLLVCASASEVYGQSSSLMRLPSAAQPSTSLLPPGESVAGSGVSGTNAAGSGFVAMPPKDDSRASTRAIEAMSMIAIPRIPPRKIKVHDLVTIIVRQQKRYEAEAELDTKKKWDIEGKLSEWFRFYPRNRLGTDQLSNGEPGFKFDFNNRFKTEADNQREDKFETRIQATVIDVKPNGNLVLEASQRETHDEEEFEITVTGICRSDDVTAANTILSTQVAELVLIERNVGAVRDATSRGWVPRVLDWAKPF